MDKNYTHITDDLLAKYVLGEVSMSEKEQVEHWAAVHPNHLKKLDDFKIIILKTGLKIDPQLDAYKALERLNARLENEPKVKKIGYKSMLRWVAVLTLFFGASWFFYHNLIDNKCNINTSENTVTQTLPDGSMVILNKHSSLSFLGGYFNKERKVNLEGEGFFKVSADKSKPFVIRINDVQVTVVGTAFNVKNSGDKTIIIVESGIVKVNNQYNSIHLIAGEKVEANKNQSHLFKEINHGKLYNYYYSNELVCDKTPLSELVVVLNEKFKANIVISNPAINSLPISTTFKNESLKEIIRIIVETFKIKVEYGEGIIKLK